MRLKLLLAAATLLVYWPALNGPYLLDDLWLGALQGAPVSLAGARPLTQLSFLAVRAVCGPSPLPQHAVNLALHILNGFLVIALVRRLLPAASPPGPALFAGGLFLLHPLVTEAVSYVASRGEVLSVCCAAGALLLFLRRPAAGLGFFSALAVLALTAAAVLAKEHAASLPALFLLADGWFLPRGIAANWRLYVPLGVSAAAGAAWLAPQLAAADSAGLGAAGLPALSYFVTQGRAIWIYLRLLLLPAGQSLDHGYPFLPATDPLGWLGLLALAALAVFAFWRRRQFPALAFGVLAALLLLAPTSSFLPIRDALVERRMYLPFLGVALAAAALAAAIRLPRRTAAPLAAMLLLACAVPAFQRNRLWGNAVAMWEDAAAGNPAHPRAQFHLGYAYYQAGRCADAVNAYERTARLATPEFRLLIDWSLALGCAGRPAGAAVKLRAAGALLTSTPASPAPAPAMSRP